VSKEVSETTSSTAHNPVLIPKEHGLHSPAGGASPRTNPAAGIVLISCCQLL